MKKHNYKKIFIRFLKEKKLYHIWLRIMKTSSWKNANGLFFKVVDEPFYICNAFNEFNATYDYDFIDGNILKDLVKADFEWKIIITTLDNKNEKHLINFVNSQYFTFSNIRDSELIDRFRYLRRQDT